MGAVDSNVTKYVTTQCSDLTEDGLPHRLELYHTGDEGRERLGVYKLSDYDDGPEPTEIAQEIWDSAEANANTLTIGAAQRFIVATFRKEEDREQESAHAFVIRGRTNALGGLTGDSDSSSPKGLLGQLMRHNEHHHTLAMQHMVESSNALRRDNERLRTRVEHLESKLAETYEARESLMDRSHARKLEEAKEQARAQRHEQMMGMLTSMGPLLLSKFLAGSAPTLANPNAAAARDQSIMGFISSLDQSEVEAIFNALSVEKKGVLLQLLSSYKEDYEKQESLKRL